MADSSKLQRMQAVKGMYDILPPESLRLNEIERISHQVLQAYGYGRIQTPIVEYTPLFARSIGEETDIVEKEMYTFGDRDGRSLTLRPEGTAGVARAYIEHALYKSEPVTQWYYLGPMFRHERSQRGRHRQFHQLNVEALGTGEASIDAEMLAMLVHLLDVLGLHGTDLHLNTLGCQQCRPRFREALVAVLAGRERDLCTDCQRRFRKNPLRVLDCKETGCQQIAASSPTVLDYVCDPCREHWEELLLDLTAQEVSYTVDPRLVRGLDYYTRTTFELLSTSGDLGSQNTVAGGGRYDGLVELLGGPPTPAVGFAMGLERLMLALKDKPSLPSAVQVSFVTQGKVARRRALSLARSLRLAGIRADVDHRSASVKSQMKRANRRGCALALIIGERELEQDVVSVREMASSEQQQIPVSELVEQVERRLK